MPTYLSSRPTVLLTMGERRGIGPETIIRALSIPRVRRLAHFLVIGDIDWIGKTKELLKAPVSLNAIEPRLLKDTGKTPFKEGAVNVLHVNGRGPGLDALNYIDEALLLIKRGAGSALVTGPVSKKTISDAGVRFSGHTEYLAAFSRVKKFAMMFVGGKLRVTTVTRHLPLRDVAGSLTKEKIVDAAILTAQFLKRTLSIEAPKIGICALNPHAGEGGTLGREDIDVIVPAIGYLRAQERYNISGPLPADSAFNLLYNGKIDSLIAMYHDQAMIPVKMIGRGSCVNITLGLPFVRTSPVHGTACDIAGRGIADPSGMIEAMKLACRLAGA